MRWAGRSGLRLGLECLELVQGPLHFVGLVQQLQHLLRLGGNLLLGFGHSLVAGDGLGAAPSLTAGVGRGLGLRLCLHGALHSTGAVGLVALRTVAQLPPQLHDRHLLRFQGAALLGAHVLHRRQHPHGAVHALLHLLHVQVPALAERLQGPDPVLELLAAGLEHADVVLVALPTTAEAAGAPAAQQRADGVGPGLLVLERLHVQLHEDAAVEAQQRHDAVLGVHGADVGELDGPLAAHGDLAPAEDGGLPERQRARPRVQRGHVHLRRGVWECRHQHLLLQGVVRLCPGGGRRRRCGHLGLRNHARQSRPHR
mmetsp:Transcript_25109/g.79773  ORF Transcript_25109/g.79773 Transcript_25109/m.79773 type:complete len:313 (-) Transcript_25109:1674-2612(-)